MATRANFTRSYLWRYILIAVLGLGWAAWCAWDVTVTYPQKLKYSRAYFEMEGLIDEDDDGERNRRWKEIVKEKGWKFKEGKYPEKQPKKIESDIQWNYLMGAGALLIGIPNLFLLITNSRAWIELDGDQITTSWGQNFSLSQVSRLNKRRWHKGIATVEYEEDDKTRYFALDDYKFDREPIDDILRTIESNLKADQIVGGEPESDKPDESELDEDPADSEVDPADDQPN